MAIAGLIKHKKSTSDLGYVFFDHPEGQKIQPNKNMSKTAAIKHTKLYTFHPQKIQTFKIRTLPTPQPKDLILCFFAWGGVKNPRCFLFFFGSSKNKTLFQGYVGVFFDEEDITKAFRCAYIPSCIVPNDSLGIF